MGDERELRVARYKGPLIYECPRGVWLECSEDGKRCGDFEEWMVEWLKGVYPNGIPQGHRESIDDYEDRLNEIIATAISRVLQEAAK